VQDTPQRPQSLLQQQSVALFAEDGLLAQNIPNYKLRQEQVEMAAEIASAIERQAVLIAEAGTGTGKTFAYLAPALISGGKVIVSTGTKTLQDQLYNKDIPSIKAALRLPVETALLKGRANYVCHYHLRQSAASGHFSSRTEVGHLSSVERFAKATKRGDKSECLEVPEDSPIWHKVTSTRENCLGQECPHHDECFVLKARREAMSVDLLVVNHHLFFADVMLRDEGMAELLPACNTVIFDEAHQVPEIASLFFGELFSTGQVVDLARDIRHEGLTSAPDCRDLQDNAQLLDKAARDLRLTLGSETGRYASAQAEEQDGFVAAIQHLLKCLGKMIGSLQLQAERSEGLQRCAERAAMQSETLLRWQQPYVGAAKNNEADGGCDERVRWVETSSHNLHLNSTPLNIANRFQQQMGSHPRAWIFTSATLAVQGNFDHFATELGLHKAVVKCWQSSFDYARQTVLYAPLGVPGPRSPQYAEAVVQAAWPVVQAASGGAFILCTSLRAMRAMYEMLATLLDESGYDWPLLMQGDFGKGELLRRFRASGKAILVGSQSFWEGVDVRGDALSLVVIDKLPFAPPDDPVLAARIEVMRRRGENAFMQYQVPQAAINIKQGAGRLIRDETDMGVLMICDPRLISQPYGKRIWRSLPPMRRTRELDDVLAFYRSVTKQRLTPTSAHHSMIQVAK